MLARRNLLTRERAWLTPQRPLAPHLACGGVRGRVLVTVVRASSSTPSFAWANRKKAPVKRSENVDGPFWVDHTCIDCDTCRWMSPSSFTRQGQQSAVTRQPETHQERVRALQALLSCPTFSIHCDARTPEELREAQQGLPAPVPGVSGVYHCGWHTESSFAASSYLIQHPGGNIMVDSPRYNPVLAKRLEEMGGIKYIFLTHKDDVGDHTKWQKHFNAVRILHKGEVTSRTGPVEIELEGDGPWPWSHILTHPDNHHRSHSAESALSAADSDIELVLTPGHTSHHVCMYHGPSHTLFTGDHLAAPERNGASDQLVMFKDFCWFNFKVQLESVAKLLEYDWTHVLPGHGRQAHFPDALARLKAVNALLMEHGYVTPVKA